ncbi:MAG: hypothetical protein PVJ33_14195 [Lysobacterales bacterium]|jgi:hypothetical protein
MKPVILTALILVSPGAQALETAPPTCAYGEPHPNAAPELSQFAFLIGDYSITLHAWDGENWSPPKAGVTARWNGRYALGGMAIMDEWYYPDPAQDPDAPRGVNVRMYDSENGEWDMMWLATQNHQVQDLRARMEDGRLVMWQVYPERPDFRAEFEISDPDHWARIGYTKDESGAWVKQYKLAATRIACPSGGG